MIILDTTVLSEPLRASPNPLVLDWMRTQTVAAVTAISVSELMVGALILPQGARRERLLTSIETILTGRYVLPFDGRAARRYAHFQERRQTLGHPLSVEDGMIAAITSVHGAVLATRNGRDFAGLDLDLVDPWAGGDDRQLGQNGPQPPR